MWTSKPSSPSKSVSNMGLVAINALSQSVITVSAEARVADVLPEIEQLRATHAAIFDGEHLLGVVSLRAILAMKQQNIFADLLRHSRIPRVPSTATLEFVGHLFDETNVDGASVHDEEGAYRGVISHDSIVKAMLLDARLHLDEIVQLKAQQERLRLLGQIASGVAHDLNNSLTPIVGHLELVGLQARLDEQTKKNIGTALTAALDAAHTVKRLQSFYAHFSDDTTAQKVDLRHLAKDISELSKPKWRDDSMRQGKNILMLLDSKGATQAWCNPSELREVLLNLVINAADAIIGDGTIRIRTATRDSKAIIEVMDTGAGMTDEQRSRCFEPFYTTKPGAGTGLGLSVCCELVQSNGGSIEIETAPLQGTTVRIVLPMANATPAKPTFDADVPLVKWRVLFVDNDPRLHSSVKGMLEALGQEVGVCASGEEALHRFREETFDVVISDLTMPIMTGIDVMRSIRIIRPEVPVVIVTGWVDCAILENSFDKEKPNKVLLKPFTIPALRATLAELQQSN